MESVIQDHPLLAGALVVGQGKRQAALILEPKTFGTSREAILDHVWSQVEQANAIAPAQGRIVRSKILVAGPGKPFARAGKGTIVRKLTERTYASEIEALYSEKADKAVTYAGQRPTLRPSFPRESVFSFVRESVLFALPTASGLSDNELFFRMGLIL